MKETDLNSPKIPSGKLPRILKMPTDSPLAQAAIDIAIGDEQEGHALKVAKCKIEELSHTVRAIDARCKGHLAEIDELTEIIENLQLQIGQHEATIEGMRKELDGKQKKETPAKLAFKVGDVVIGPKGKMHTICRSIFCPGDYILEKVKDPFKSEAKLCPSTLVFNDGSIAEGPDGKEYKVMLDWFGDYILRKKRQEDNAPSPDDGQMKIAPSIIDEKPKEESPAKFVFKVGTVAKGPDGNEYTVSRLDTGLYTLVKVDKPTEAPAATGIMSYRDYVAGKFDDKKNDDQ